MGWRELVGDHGRIVSLEHFGASADYATHLPRVRHHRRGRRLAAEDSLAAATG